jgi:uncharacterized protein (TIGR00255 family)
MTGFTGAAGQHGAIEWTWEIRSVNSRGLDLRVRLPSGYEKLEAVVREAAGKVLKRGSVAVSLALTRAAGGSAYRVNRELLDHLLDTAGELRKDKRLAAEAPRLDTLLTVRGVVEPAEADGDPDEAEARDQAVAASLDAALAALIAARQAEGAKLEAVLRARLDELAGLCGEAESAAAARAGAVRERLAQQLAELLDASPALPEERLAQEAAVLAVKGDVREELDRLKAHLEAARELLDEGGAIGPRLDFLCQEFNREANTLCSKSGDVELTRIGLAMKAAVDQFREQALNIE